MHFANFSCLSNTGLFCAENAFDWLGSSSRGAGRFRLLPSNVLVIVLGMLTLAELLRLTETCRDLRNLHAHFVHGMVLAVASRLRVRFAACMTSNLRQA